MREKRWTDTGHASAHTRHEADDGFFPAVPVYCNTAAILPKQANMMIVVLQNKIIAVKTRPYEHSFHPGDCRSNAPLWTQMCGHIALWLVVVTGAPRPPVCSSSTSWRHPDSTVSRSGMMPACLWRSCLLFNLCQRGALLFKAPDLFTAPPHRLCSASSFGTLSNVPASFFLLFFLFLFFMPNSLPPPSPPPSSPLPHGSFSPAVYFFTDSCQTPRSCRDIISSWYELSQ